MFFLRLGRRFLLRHFLHFVAFGGLVTPQLLQTVLLILCFLAISIFSGSLSDMVFTVWVGIVCWYLGVFVLAVGYFGWFFCLWFLFVLLLWWVLLGVCCLGFVGCACYF